MPVGCFLPHAYDPIPLEFREKETRNGNDSNPNPIGEAHSLFYDEPDIISRAEVSFDRAQAVQFAVTLTLLFADMGRRSAATLLSARVSSCI